jgi:hypothetical protein
MKLRHVVVHTQDGENHNVLFTSRFEWIAALVLYFWLPRLDGEIEIVQMDLHPQNVLGRLLDLQRTKDVLWQLVAKDDEGRWATVHDADVPVPEEDNIALNKVFLHA